MEYFKSMFNKTLCAYRKKYGTEHVLIKLGDSWKFALDKINMQALILWAFLKPSIVYHIDFICQKSMHKV